MASENTETDASDDEKCPAVPCNEGTTAPICNVYYMIIDKVESIIVGSSGTPALSSQTTNHNAIHYDTGATGLDTQEEYSSFDSVFSEDFNQFLSDKRRSSSNKSLPKNNSDTTHGLQSKLQLLYNRCTLPCIPWLNNGDDLTIDEYYTELELDTSDTTIQVKEILTNIDDKNPQRILIEGQPGYGKTTLANKIVLDWALSKPYIKHFKLVFLLPLRYLQEKTIPRAIAERAAICGFSDIQNIDEIIQENMSETLLVIDGLDELKSTKRMNILRLLYKQVFPEMTVIVTCRTDLFSLDHREYESLFAGANVKKAFYDKRINISGIAAKDRKSFLTKFVAPNIAEVLMKQIEKLPEAMAGMFKSPLILILLAFMASKNESTKMTTKTQLFKRLFNYLINHSMLKNSTSGEEIDLFEIDLPMNEVQRTIQRFGQLSESHIRAGNLKFEYNPLTTKVYNMGLLSNRKELSSFTSTSDYKPYHLTILEFAVAFSIWVDFKEEIPTAFHFIRPLYIDLGDTSLIFPFLVGLLQDDAIKLFERLQPYAHVFSTSSNSLKSFVSDYEETSASAELLPILVDFVSPYVPHYENVLTNFSTSHFYHKILKCGIEKSKVDFIQICPQTPIETLRGVTIPNLIIEDNMYSSGDLYLWLKTIKCKNLTIRIDEDSDFFVRNIFDFLKNIRLLSNIPSESLSLVLRKYVELFFPYNKVIKLTKIDQQLDIDCSHEDIVPYLVIRNLVESLTIDAVHSDCEKILRVAGESSQLHSLHLSGDANPLPIDLYGLTDGGNKQYKCLMLTNCRLTCNVTTNYRIYCLILKNTNVDELNLIKPTVLYCSASHFNQLSDWVGHSSLEELSVILDSSSNDAEFWKHLSNCKNMNVLQLILFDKCKNPGLESSKRVIECLQQLKIKTFIIEFKKATCYTAEQLVKDIATSFSSPSSSHSLKTITVRSFFNKDSKEEVENLSAIIDILLGCLRANRLTSVYIICENTSWCCLMQKNIIDHSVFSVTHLLYGSATTDPYYYQILYDSFNNYSFCIKLKQNC